MSQRSKKMDLGFKDNYLRIKEDLSMRKLVISIFTSGIIFPMFFAGCATYENYEEVSQRADRALEQAELANQRIDQLAGAYGGK